MERKINIMKFSVEVIETLRRLVDVNAETADDAAEIVEKMYDDEKIVLCADDFVNVKFSVFQEKRCLLNVYTKYN